MNTEAMEALLTDAIKAWMTAPTHTEYRHGCAQGIAKAIAAGRGTSFTVEWEAGLDAYQRTIVAGEVKGPDDETHQ